MEYANFELTFGPRAAAGYPVSAESRLGQAPEAGQPAPVSALDPADANLAAALEALRRGRTEAAGLKALGQALAAAIPDDILSLLREQRAAARAQPGHGVRLRLNFAEPAPAALPWELLWLPGDPAPLGLSTDAALTRALDLRVPWHDRETPLPVRLLGIAPNAPNLQLAQHKAALEEAIAPMRDSGALEFEWLDGAVTADRIRAALGRAETHLVHFVGHGSFENGQPRLHLNDDYGDDYPRPAGVVAGLFRDRPSLRLVVLNACRGAAANSADALLGLAPQIAAQGVPAIVAMQWDIYEWAAQKFATEFYRTLCAGPAAGEVETALTRARAALYDDNPEARGYATPVLLLRGEGGRLWTAKPEADTRPAGGEMRDSIILGANTRIGGDVFTGGKREVHTGGGAYFESDVNVTDGDFVLGNKTVNQRAGRDIIGRDKVTHVGGPDPVQMQILLEKFRQIQAQVDTLSAAPAAAPTAGQPAAAGQPPVGGKKQVKELVQQIEAETQQGEAADPDRLERWLTALGDAAEDIFEVTAATLVNPAYGLAQAVRRVAQRVIEKRAGRRGGKQAP